MKRHIIITWPGGQEIIHDRFHGRSWAANIARGFIRDLEAEGVQRDDITAVRREAATDSDDWRDGGPLDRAI
jgi:hypothetical protein